MFVNRMTTTGHDFTDNRELEGWSLNALEELSIFNNFHVFCKQYGIQRTFENYCKYHKDGILAFREACSQFNQSAERRDGR
jgi:hypothetical protein